MPNGHKKIPEAARFWDLVDRKGPDECWPWKGSCDSFGYGIFRNEAQELEKAHRSALRISGRPVGPNMRALHHCDNPPCCNLGHLYEGTAKDNAQDRERRGRRKISRGHAHPRATITEETARAIRDFSGSGAEAGRAFGVSMHVVYAIRRNRTWRHLK